MSSEPVTRSEVFVQLRRDLYGGEQAMTYVMSFQHAHIHHPGSLWGSCYKEDLSNVMVVVQRWPAPTSHILCWFCPF
ncbi:uncharacterized protein ACO6RY_04230 [Pungitius sinensis]